MADAPQPLVGLSSAQARDALEKAGPNVLAAAEPAPWKRLAKFFWGPIAWMIEAAAILSLVLRDYADFAIILVMLLANAGVGFWQEFKADSAIKALKARLAPTARVLRDGAWTDLPAAELAPGDVVALGLGGVVPADAQLVEGAYLSVDESALTGESAAVDKAVGDTVYSGSLVKLGDMRARVTATGAATLFGKTAGLVASAQSGSHFQKAVLKIGNFLIILAAALVLVIFAVALVRREPFAETLQFVLVLTVAAIPVAMPAVLSVTMAVGAARLAKLDAIVSRLAAIEELAGMDLLCSDKTGTLTQNAMTVTAPAPAEGRTEAELFLAAALACNPAGPDATDRAVLAVADGVSRASYAVGEFTPFDPVSKLARAKVTGPDGPFEVAKGAPQAILALVSPTTAQRAAWEAGVLDLAARGYRALAVARTDADGAWTWLGLLPIFDPPREDSAATIARIRQMGVTVKMITGDHEAIARQIGQQVGLQGEVLNAGAVFDGHETTRSLAAAFETADAVARVFPEHKFKIVQAFQSEGRIVGMTGDGVNDAPALKQADAGVAVSGATDAARAAADIVLTSPGLAVIATAIEEARMIFARMTSYAIFRISETCRVLLFMTLAILIYDFYPLTAAMIVILALLNDFPIMMIAYDNARASRVPARWEMRRVLSMAAALGVSGVAASFTLFWYCDSVLKLPRETIQTLIFLKLLVAGHLTLYVTRAQGWFFTRPWPSLKLLGVSELTQVIGTLMAVYGGLVHPVGWKAALLIWAYALAWLPISSLVALAVRKLTPSSPSQPLVGRAALAG